MQPEPLWFQFIFDLCRDLLKLKYVNRSIFSFENMIIHEQKNDIISDEKLNQLWPIRSGWKHKWIGI